MSRAFVFPGQGAQVIGMGRALAESWAEARAVFDEVDEALGPLPKTPNPPSWPPRSPHCARWKPRG